MSFLAVSPSGNSQLNHDSLLGFIEFHAISDLRILKQDLASLWGKHRLPQELLNGEIRPCDAFRRASADAQQTVSVNWNGSQYKARLLVREVKSDDSEIIRLLVREVVDSRNEVLDYASAGKMAFQRDNNQVMTTCEWPLLSEFSYDSILQRVEQTYDEFVNFHTRDTLRNLVTKLIRATNPVSIISRSQGKFIPKAYHPLLLGLKGLLNDLRCYANGNECSVDLIPLVNSAEQRELVARRASVELTGEMDTLVSELAEHLKKGDQNLSTVQRLASRAIDIEERVKEYEKLLSIRLNVLRTQLGTFIDQVTVTKNAV